MKIKRTLIACNVFQDEMEYVLSRNHDYEVETIWIRAGLHNDLGLLEKALNEAFEKIPGNSSELRLMIGRGCLPHLPELAAERGIPLLSAKNCVWALLGEERLRELERGKTMVITPAWIRKTWFAEDGMRTLLGWDDADFRINFGRYDRILVLDAGLCPLTDEETLEAFEILQVPIESEIFVLDHFEQVFLNFLGPLR
jgi:hypothetical protein